MKARYLLLAALFLMLPTFLMAAEEQSMIYVERSEKMAQFCDYFQSMAFKKATSKLKGRMKSFAFDWNITGPEALSRISDKLKCQEFFSTQSDTRGVDFGHLIKEEIDPLLEKAPGTNFVIITTLQTTNRQSFCGNMSCVADDVIKWIQRNLKIVLVEIQIQEKSLFLVVSGEDSDRMVASLDNHQSISLSPAFTSNLVVDSDDRQRIEITDSDHYQCNRSRLHSLLPFLSLQPTFHVELAPPPFTDYLGTLRADRYYLFTDSQTDVELSCVDKRDSLSQKKFSKKDARSIERFSFLTDCNGKRHQYLVCAQNIGYLSNSDSGFRLNDESFQRIGENLPNTVVSQLNPLKGETYKNLGSLQNKLRQTLEGNYTEKIFRTVAGLSNTNSHQFASWTKEGIEFLEIVDNRLKESYHFENNQIRPLHHFYVSDQ